MENYAITKAENRIADLENEVRRLKFESERLRSDSQQLQIDLRRVEIEARPKPIALGDGILSHVIWAVGLTVISVGGGLIVAKLIILLVEA